MTVLQSARQAYEETCESLFASWIADSPSAASPWHGFSLKHCPEPYLDFAVADRSVLWITHNPGRGEEFQLRGSVDSDRSPIRSDLSYAENAKRLANWYAGRGALKISAAARARIASMQNFGARLGFAGLRQIELFPLHSESRPPDEFLFGNPDIQEPLKSYGRKARELIAASPLVIGLCGSAPHRSANAVQSWAKALAMDPEKAELVFLSDRTDAPTVGMLVSRSGPRVSVLFCRQGSNGLPGKDRMPMVIKSIQTALNN